MLIPWSLVIGCKLTPVTVCWCVCNISRPSSYRWLSSFMGEFDFGESLLRFMAGQTPLFYPGVIYQDSPNLVKILSWQVVYSCDVFMRHLHPWEQDTLGWGVLFSLVFTTCDPECHPWTNSPLIYFTIMPSTITLEFEHEFLTGRPWTRIFEPSWRNEWQTLRCNLFCCYPPLGRS